MAEKHRARRHRSWVRSSTLAAAAICVVVVGLAGFAGLLQPAVAWEQLSSSWEARGVEVGGNLIAHDWGTEIRLAASGTQDGQSHRVTLVSKDEEQIHAGTFIGTGDELLRCKLNAALLRKDAARLEVRTPDGELVFSNKLPEEPRVELFGIFPWPDSSPQTDPGAPNEITRQNAEDNLPEDTRVKAKDGGSGDGAPHKGSSPGSDGKSPSPGGVEPGAVPNENEPGRGRKEHPPYYQSSQEKPPTDYQYEPRP